MSQTHFNFEIQSDLGNLPLVEEFIEESAKKLRLDRDTVNSLLIAVNEATNNAVVHANKSDPDKKVQISLSQQDNIITVSVTDEGEGFNPEEVPDPTLPENILKDHGRGIYIMRSCVGDIEYVFHPNGTELKLHIKPCR